MDLSKIKYKELLPWLNLNQKEKIFKRIKDSCIKELTSRHWGSLAPGSSKFGQPKIYLSDIRGLFLASGLIKYTLSEFDTKLFYRGQTKDYPLKPSLYRTAKNQADVSKFNSQIDKTLNEIKNKFVLKGPDNEREAVAQHYGMKTRWLDILDHFQTAAWFAYHRENYPVDNNSPDGCKFDDDVGYIYLLACPATSKEILYCDLRDMPSDWLRPHIQQAFSIRALNHTKDLVDYSFLLVATFIVQRKDLYEWSNFKNLPPNFIYPNFYQDNGLKHWVNTKEHLKNNKIIVPPYIIA